MFIVSTPFLSQIHATSWLCNQGPRYYIRHCTWYLVTCPPQPLPCYNLLLCSLFPHRWVNSTYRISDGTHRIPNSSLAAFYFFCPPEFATNPGSPCSFPCEFPGRAGEAKVRAACALRSGYAKGSQHPTTDWRMMEDHRYQQNSPIYSYHIYIYIFQYQIPHDSSQKKQNMNRGSTKPI